MADIKYLGKEGHEHKFFVAGREFTHKNKREAEKLAHGYAKSATTPTIKEDAPTNSMGSSSATPGSGAIDTFNPVLNRNKVVKRVVTMWKKLKEEATSHDRRRN